MDVVELSDDEADGGAPAPPPAPAPASKPSPSRQPTSSSPAKGGAGKRAAAAATKASAGLMQGWLKGDAPKPTAAPVAARGSAVVDLTADSDEDDHDGGRSAAAAAPAPPPAPAGSSSTAAPASAGTSWVVPTPGGGAAYRPNPGYRPVDTPVWTYHPTRHACWLVVGGDGVAGADGAQPPPRPSAPYAHLARAFACIEPVTGRIRIVGQLVNAFRTLLAAGGPGDVHAALLLATNSLGSPHEGLTLHVGGSTVAGAVSAATGVKRERLSKLYEAAGDMGDVAEACVANQRTLVPPPPLTVAGLLGGLHELGAQSGPGSAARKQGLITRLLRCCREGAETRYVVRTLLCNLRVGVNVTTALEALARAVALNEALGGDAAVAAAPCDAWAGPPAPAAAGGRKVGGGGTKATGGKRSGAASSAPSSSSSSSAAALDAGYTADMPPEVAAAMDAAAAAVKTAHSQCPDLELIVTSLLAGGVSRMTAACRVAPGVPVRPMLAKITSGLEDVMTKFSRRWFTAEWKYDGQRSQIHLLAPAAATTAVGADVGAADVPSGSSAATAAGGSVRIFSRHLDDTTARWPDVTAVVQEAFVPAAPGGGAGSASSANGPSFIIDAELVAVEVTPVAAEDGGGGGGGAGAAAGAASNAAASSIAAPVRVRILPFQTLSTRKRTDVAADGGGVSVCVYAFDMLFLHGTPLTHLPLVQRRALLRRHFRLLPGRFDFAAGVDVLGPPLPEAGGGDDVTGVAAFGDGDGEGSAAAGSAVPAVAVGASTFTGGDGGSGSSSGAATTLTGDYDGVREALTSFLMSALDGSCEGVMCKLLAADDDEYRRFTTDGGAAAAAGGAVSATGGGDESNGGAGAADADDDEVEVVAPSPPRKRARGAAASSSAASVSSAASTPQRTGGGKRGAAAAPLVATYQPSVRSNAWLKVKRDYVPGLADTLDLVRAVWRGRADGSAVRGVWRLLR
jgi:DNA ligase 1